MATAVIFPKVSLETDAGTIARWLKDDGAQVEQGDPLFEIDNDKAAVEVEATASGIVAHLRKAGDEVQVGEVVAQILAPGEQPGTEKKAPLKQEPVPGAPGPATETAGPQSSQPSSRIIATPLARRLAAQRQIDLRGIRGSGPKGRIQKRDLIDMRPAVAATASVPASQGEHLNAVWLRKDGASTLVALHGFASDHNAWRSLLAAGRPKARMLAVELPGHGRSPRTIPSDLDGICEMVEQRLALEGIEEATFMGHSFGAAVAARLASRGMVSVNSLLLISPAGLGPEIRHQFIRGFVAARQPASLVPWLHELVFDPSHISEAFIRIVAEQRKDDGLSNALERLAAHYFCNGTQTFSIRQDLEKLRMPARIIFGVQDRIIPFAHCQALPARVGLHAFGQCGHLPYLEQPELTLSLVNEMVALAEAAR